MVGRKTLVLTMVVRVHLPDPKSMTERYIMDNSILNDLLGNAFEKYLCSTKEPYRSQIYKNITAVDIPNDYYDLADRLDEFITKVKEHLKLDSLCPIYIVNNYWSHPATFCLDLRAYIRQDGVIRFNNTGVISNPIIIIDLYKMKQHYAKTRDLELTCKLCIAHEITHFGDYQNKRLKFNYDGSIEWFGDIPTKVYMREIYLRTNEEIWFSLYNSLPWEAKANSVAYHVLYKQGIHYPLPEGVVKHLNHDIKELYIKNSEITHTCVSDK